MITVGFDLDMTLIDSVDTIVDSLVAVVQERGKSVDPQAIRDTIGMPFPLVLPTLVPDDDPEELLAAYRAHYRVHGVPKTKAMPGAIDAVQAVRDAGGRVVVVTAKQGITAMLWQKYSQKKKESHLKNLGLRFMWVTTQEM